MVLLPLRWDGKVDFLGPLFHRIPCFAVPLFVLGPLKPRNAASVPLPRPPNAPVPIPHVLQPVVPATPPPTSTPTRAQHRALCPPGPRTSRGRTLRLLTHRPRGPRQTPDPLPPPGRRNRGLPPRGWGPRPPCGTRLRLPRRQHRQRS